MSDQTRRRQLSPAEVDLAAELVLATIDDACGSESDFRDRVEAAVEAAVGLLSGEPRLAESLTAPLGPPAALKRQASFRADCAARLRAAAETATGREEQIPFVEPFLVAGVQFQVANAGRNDELESLSERVPELRDFICSHYPDSTADRVSIEGGDR